MIVCSSNGESSELKNSQQNNFSVESSKPPESQDRTASSKDQSNKLCSFNNLMNDGAIYQCADAKP